MLRPGPRTRTAVLALLAAYVLALTLIAFWPTHVDEGAGPFLAALERMLPWATHPRIEFAANIVLFAPLGLLLTLLVRRWEAVLLFGVGLSALIELVQAIALPGRTGTPGDIVANGLGTLAGIAVALLWLRARERRRADAAEQAASRVS